MILDEFKSYKCEIEGNKENSIDQYIIVIKKFFDYFKVDYKDINKITEINSNDIKQWLMTLNQSGNSAKTRNHRLAVIKEFYRFLQVEKDLIVDPKINFMRYSKTPHKEKLFLDIETCDLLLRKTTEIRTKAVISVILTTGCRFSDLESITTKDIDNGYAVVYGKGNKERYLYFDNKDTKCLEIVRKYIDKKRKKIIENTGVKTDLLFLSNNGNKLDINNFRKELKHYAKKCGIECWKDISPHILRHSFATNKLESGCDIGTIRDALGHTNISTTNTYIHTNREKVREMMEGRI